MEWSNAAAAAGPILLHPVDVDGGRCSCHLLLLDADIEARPLEPQHSALLRSQPEAGAGDGVAGQTVARCAEEAWQEGKVNI